MDTIYLITIYELLRKECRKARAGYIAAKSAYILLECGEYTGNATPEEIKAALPSSINRLALLQEARKAFEAEHFM